MNIVVLCILYEKLLLMVKMENESDIFVINLDSIKVS